MVRASIVIFITLALLVGGIVEVYHVNKTINTLEKEAHQLLVLFEQNKEDLTKIEDDIIKIKEDWLKFEKHMSVVFNYKDTNIISDNLSNIQSAFYLNNYEEGYNKLQLLLLLIQRNKFSMIINFETIF